MRQGCAGGFDAQQVIQVRSRPIGRPPDALGGRRLILALGVMGHIHHSLAGLRIIGDELDPSEITRLLGVNPTKAFRKGEIEHIRPDGTPRYARTGRWRLDANRREPEDLEAQVFEILSRITDDLEVWRDLATRFKIDLFCGIFLDGSNDGLPLSHNALLALGQRGISIDLDIYDAS